MWKRLKTAVQGPIYEWPNVHRMTKPERNTRAVELWLESNSWRSIASQLSDEGLGSVSHQYIARVVKRELSRAWQGAYYYFRPRVPERAIFQTLHSSQQHDPFAELSMPDDDVLPEQVGALATDDSDATETRTEIIVESFFNARHFVIMDEQTGPPHGHSYRARLMATGTVDPKTGIVIGFAQAQSILDDAVMQFAEELLNRLEVFENAQPTTENLALTIANSVKEQLEIHDLQVTSITLWESPTKGVTVTLNPKKPHTNPDITEAGDQPFISS